MMSNTVPVSLSMKANTYAFGDEERKRREAALKNKDFYYGRQIQYISLVNSDVVPVMINLTTPIVDKRASLLYSQPAVREFEGPSSSISFLKAFYDDIHVDFILKNADLMAELTGTCLICVTQDENGLRLIPYDASQFSPVPKGLENESLEALSLISEYFDVQMNGSNIQVAQKVRTQIWTPNYLYEFVDNIELKTSANELGFIPFVQIKAQEVPHQYLGHCPISSVRKINSQINQSMTELGYMIRMQSATPIVLSGFSNGEALQVHPGTAISLPAGASATTLPLSPAIGDTLGTIQYLEEKIYEIGNTPRISITGSMQGSTSGVELMIKWAPLLSVYKEKALRYQRYELNLANMILRVAGLEPLKNIRIKYSGDVMPIDTEYDKLETDIAMNVRTPIDEIMKRNPSMTEDEADAEFTANAIINQPINGGLDARYQQGSGIPTE